jgi:Ni,Fe-hydrogenase III large subunit
VSGASSDFVTGGRNIQLGFDDLDLADGLKLAGMICARSSIAHSLAYCQALEEAVAVERVDDSALAFRAIVAEYERIASHLGVLSDIARSISDDVVYKGPRRHAERIRDAFTKVSGNPFGRGLIVPGGVSIPGDGKALEELREVLKPLERDCGFWTKKLSMSRARLRGSRLEADRFDYDAPCAPALRASGLARDTRSGESAYGYYAASHYRPCVREGGTAYDRALLLLDEVRASAGLVGRAVAAEGVSPGVPMEFELCAGKGVGVCESPEGAIEHVVFLGEGKLIRNRVSSAVPFVAGLMPGALEGSLYEDVAPALISMYPCAPCLDLRNPTA